MALLSGHKSIGEVSDVEQRIEDLERKFGK
jgi:hypothetical protein